MVLERTDQPLAVDPPLLREIRAAMAQGGRERARRRAAPCRTPASPALRGRAGARLLLGLLRPRQPRPPARRHRRRGGQHAPRRRAIAGSSTSASTSSARARACPSSRSGRRSCSRATRTWRSCRSRAAGRRQPAARRLDRAAHPLGGRLGRDHDGQEPRDDGVRAVRPAHQGEPEVRLGEEGTADDVLRGARARADPAQLRAEARGRGALARPERVPPQRPARRPRRRRRVRDPERRSRPRRSGATLPRAARRAIRERKIRVFVLDAFAIARDEASDVELRYRMQGAAFMGAFFRDVAAARARAGLDEKRSSSRASRKQLAEEVRPPRRAAWWRTTCA